MPLIDEIPTDSCSDVEINSNALVTIPAKSEELYIQPESINLCFIENHDIDIQDEFFISDALQWFSSNDGNEIASEREACVPVIQEIDSCKELLMCDSAYSPTETDTSYSVNVDSCEKLLQGEDDSTNGLMCKFLKCTIVILIIGAYVVSVCIN